MMRASELLIMAHAEFSDEPRDQLIYADRNEFRYPPAPAVMDVFRSLRARTVMEYSAASRTAERSQLITQLAEYHEVDSDTIALGYGAEHLLRAAVRHFAMNGEVVVWDAVWPYYGQMISEARATARPFDHNVFLNEYNFDLISLRFELQRNPRATVLINSPNNPTGNEFPYEVLKELLELYPDATFIVDEVYWDYVERGEIFSAVPMTQWYPNLVVIRGFSKGFGLAGLRIAYVIGGSSDRVRELLALTNAYLGYNTVSERVAITALDPLNRQYYYPLYELMAEDKHEYYRRLTKISDVLPFQSSGNFFLMRLSPERWDTLTAALPHSRYRLKLFFVPPFEHHVRISICTRDENHEIMNFLERIWT